MLKKLRELIIQELTKGTTPQSLALACAFGVVLGNFPLMGTTTGLCLMAGVIFRLNQPLLQLVNYGMLASQILLIPIFLWIGETILGLPHLSLDPRVVMETFMSDKALFFANFGMAGLHAILAWVLIAIPVGGVVFFTTRILFTRLIHRIHRHQARKEEGL